jgi:hypothetical protein
MPLTTSQNMPSPTRHGGGLSHFLIKRYILDRRRQLREALFAGHLGYIPFSEVTIKKYIRVRIEKCCTRTAVPSKPLQLCSIAEKSTNKKRTEWRRFRSSALQSKQQRVDVIDGDLSCQQRLDGANRGTDGAVSVNNNLLSGRCLLCRVHHRLERCSDVKCPTASRPDIECGLSQLITSSAHSQPKRRFSLSLLTEMCL